MGRTRWSPCAVVAAWGRGRSSSGSDRRRRAGGAVALLTLLLAVTGCGDPGASGATGTPGRATVVRVVDGDTVVVRLGGREEHLRLIGIDTPESVDPRKPVQCFGREASRRLKALLPEGTVVRIERDVEQRDHFGRLLGYLWRAGDDLFVNRAMVADGFAHPLSIPPNVAYGGQFAAAAAAARTSGLGLWRACPGE